MHDVSTLDTKLHFGATHLSSEECVKMAVNDVSFWYGEKQALRNVTLQIYDNEATAFIGPSGCGKSTLLRCLNRTNDLIPGTRMTGAITLDGRDIYDQRIEPCDLRKRFGWVAQKPNPFAKSIYENVAFGVRIKGLAYTRAETDALVYDALEQAGLWNEVKDRLHDYGTDLSGGQQQRLCIARAIATKPDVILMDEPCSALDPTATRHVEDLIDRLKEKYAIVIITHNLQQAARVAQRCAFFHLGRLVEAGTTLEMFTQPTTEICRDYITGRFG